MRIIILYLLITLPFCELLAQAPPFNWQKPFVNAIGSTGYVFDMVEAPDKGIIILAMSDANHVHDSIGVLLDEIYLAKVDSVGNLQWEKWFGGSETDRGVRISTSNDGGYIIAGSTSSNDFTVSGNHGTMDAWLVKVNANGDLEWQKCYGGQGYEYATDVASTPDNGFIFCAAVSENGGDITGVINGTDYWVVKVDSIGTIQWQKCLGGTHTDIPNAIIHDNGKYIIAGGAYSVDVNVTGNHGMYDYWITELDYSGNLVRQKCFGGSQVDYCQGLASSGDGGYYLAGLSHSQDGDVIGHSPNGTSDYWCIKINSTFDIVWSAAFGGNGIDECMSVAAEADGSVVLAGESWSNNGDINQAMGYCDYWLVKVGSNGEIQWQKSLGGSDVDAGRVAIRVSDGGYIAGGGTASYDLYVTRPNGANDGYAPWIVKMGGFPSAIDNQVPSSDIFVHPNPSSGIVNVTLPGDHGETNLLIFDLQGKKLLNLSVHAPVTVLDLRNYAAGTYLLQAISQDKVMHRKLVIH